MKMEITKKLVKEKREAAGKK